MNSPGIIVAGWSVGWLAFLMQAGYFYQLSFWHVRLGSFYIWQRALFSAKFLDNEQWNKSTML